MNLADLPEDNNGMSAINQVLPSPLTRGTRGTREPVPTTGRFSIHQVASSMINAGQLPLINKFENDLQRVRLLRLELPGC